MFRPTLLAGAILLGMTAAAIPAASTTTYFGPVGVPNVVLVDPATGNPYAAGGGGGGSSGPLAVTITQTRVTLAAGTSTLLIAANSTRKSLSWSNTGTAPFTVVPGSGPAVAGVGRNYDPGSSSINQGGGTDFSGSSVPTNSFTAISTAGTTVTIWEGN